MLCREFGLSPWGVMAWGATPRSSRLQPGEMSLLYSSNVVKRLLSDSASVGCAKTASRSVV
jgi:hypothetical protein